MANNLTLEDIDNLYLWYTRLEGNELESKEEILDIYYITAKNSLPKEIFKLNSLEQLDIEVEDLTEIPKEIGNLTNLVALDISGCHNLKELPKEIGNLTKLGCNGDNRYGDALRIRDCHNLKELPKEIGNLSNLRVLEIIGCHNLKELPKEIENLDLNISLYNCPNLKELPKEYWNKGATRNYRICIEIKNGDNVELLKSTLDSAINNSANKSLELKIELYNIDECHIRVN
ncbi:hypothetical protein [Brachyspira catarrhinii]|uniref:Disease resistance R13L4/SHOC-2-like LRR domain-containing protein n=1 Tax=Brachyspira catarrhinii TaxID=2528966 RepID=A0ABY2TUJ3_9SPIR|nr:hypothetical protein [Brachyspira catarrhinii]TKZ36268.1 hypothetical protein EZH24_01035 [Brachyspira catarrhinii]